MKHIKHVVTITVAIIACAAIFMGVRHMTQKPCPQEDVTIQYATRIGSPDCPPGGPCPD